MWTEEPSHAHAELSEAGVTESVAPNLPPSGYQVGTPKLIHCQTQARKRFCRDLLYPHTGSFPRP